MVSPPVAKVVSFSLIDALTNKVLIESIQDNSTIDVSTYGALAVNVRTNTVGDAIGSVRFDLNGQTNYRMENVSPYALGGDKNANYLVWPYSAGKQNTVVATPFSGLNGKGNAGASKQLHFTLV